MKRFFKTLLWIIVAALFIGTFVFLFKNSQPKVDRYEIVEPVVGTIERTTVLTGTIDPRDEIEIKPQISGIIAEINVEAGDFVREGDIIAKIKVIPDENQLNQAQNRLDVARIALNQAQLEHNRTAQLYDKKFVSREEFEKSETTLRQAQQEVDAATDALSIVRDGISSVNAQQSNTLVRATIDGQVLEVPVKVGSSVIQANTMNDGTTIAKVADMNKLIFDGKVDETEVGLLRQGMPTEIVIGALPDVRPMATIEYIAPKSTTENGSNTFQVKAAIVVPDSVTLRAGYSANARVTLLSAADILTIPEGVVEWSGDSTFVYVLDNSQGDKQQFTRRAITTGVSDGVNIEVRSGITTDDRLRGNIVNDNPARRGGPMM